MPRPLFDRDALNKHRARAAEDGLFLHDVAIELIKERLEEINKTFAKTGIISWQARRWADGLGITANLMDAAEHLPLAPSDKYDLLIHGLELHWMDDPVGQLIQMRRALKSDGLMIAVLFGSRTLANLRAALTHAEVDVTGGLSPRMAPFADLRDLGGLLQRAGFALPVADSHVQNIQYASAGKLLSDLRDMGETNALADRLKHFSRPSMFRRLFQNLQNPSDLRTEFELVFLTGWAPSDTQQKPLKPGSATHKLADILTELQNDRKT